MIRRMCEASRASAGSGSTASSHSSGRRASSPIAPWPDSRNAASEALSRGFSRTQRRTPRRIGSSSPASNPARKFRPVCRRDSAIHALTHWPQSALQAVTDWPWSTFAAFAAAGAAIVAVGIEIRERRRALACEAVAELAAESSRWNTRSAAFLRNVERFNKGLKSRQDINNEFVTLLTDASSEMTRALILVQLACNDSEFLSKVDGARHKIDEFLSIVARSETAESEQAEAERLAAAIESGLSALDEISYLTSSAVERGMRVYRRRRSWRQVGTQQLAEFKKSVPFAR